jgi:hypothetical protein
VGPEAGPIRSLEWNGERLVVNDRWVVTAASPLASAWLVDEQEADWMTDRPAARRIEVEDGWAAARLDLPGPGRYDFTVEDMSPAAPIDRAIGRITSDGMDSGPTIPSPVSANRSSARERPTGTRGTSAAPSGGL